MEQTKMHTCSHKIGNAKYTWNVHHLWELVKDIEPIPMSMDQFEHTFDWQMWGDEPITPKILLDHYTQTVECDLHYPIIITLNAWNKVDHIYDGFHRLVKAKYKEHEKIMVKVIQEEILTQKGNYLEKIEYSCAVCDCNPCDCDWGSYT